MPQESSLAAEVTLEDLIDMVGDDADVLRELVNSFLDDSPNILQAMEDGLIRRDAEVLERSAHTIKSSSRLFRAEQFAQKCQMLEDAARQEDWEKMEPLCTQLQTDYGAIAAVLISKLEQI